MIERERVGKKFKVRGRDDTWAMSYYDVAPTGESLPTDGSIVHVKLTFLSATEPPPSMVPGNVRTTVEQLLRWSWGTPLSEEEFMKVRLWDACKREERGERDRHAMHTHIHTHIHTRIHNSRINFIDLPAVQQGPDVEVCGPH